MIESYGRLTGITARVDDGTASLDLGSQQEPQPHTPCSHGGSERFFSTETRSECQPLARGLEEKLNAEKAL